ncbi:hypothetical protein [Roseococcus microcysteis]|uniref:hypothetical protein n=1 Tax=Roseococcus microcysteis TaxID=2771361 RepID=UPI00168BC04D|nr:hypothetical protein [Roseococcus microcysteis]
MNTTRNLIAAALLLGAPVLAQAADYPRQVGSGEDMTIEYGPAAQGNIVGGGGTVVTFSGPSPSIRYTDDAQVQRRTDGLVPVMVDQGETRTITFVAPEAATSPRLAGLLSRN